MPAVPPGRIVEYQRTKTPKGWEIEARYGEQRWNLEYQTNLLGYSSWAWEPAEKK